LLMFLCHKADVLYVAFKAIWTDGFVMRVGMHLLMVHWSSTLMLCWMRRILFMLCWMTVHRYFLNMPMKPFFFGSVGPGIGGSPGGAPGGGGIPGGGAPGIGGKPGSGGIPLG